MKQVSYQQDKDKIEAVVCATKMVVTDRNLTLSISADDLKMDAEPIVTRDEFESALKRIQTLEIELASRATQPK